MNLVSFDFIIFLIVVTVLFYTLKRLQKYILLFASILFYISISAVNPS